MHGLQWDSYLILATTREELRMMEEFGILSWLTDSRIHEVIVRLYAEYFCESLK
jgi:hypothetical protein